ncbi:hypothetical protein D3C80_2217860 [compost metagenome]
MPFATNQAPGPLQQGILDPGLGSIEGGLVHQRADLCRRFLAIDHGRANLERPHRLGETR